MMVSFLVSLVLALLLSIPVLFLSRWILRRTESAELGLLFTRTLFVGLACLPWLMPLLARVPGISGIEQATPLVLELGFLLDSGRSNPVPESSASSAGFDGLLALTLLWLIGAASLLLHFLGERLHYHRLTRLAVPVDPRALPITMPKSVRVASTASPTGAFVGGLRKPVIIVPAHYLQDGSNRASARTSLAAILKHELAHIDNRDTAWLPACRILLCVSWPVLPLWLLYHDLQLQTEMAADARALRNIDEKGRKHYAAALLDAVRQNQRPAPSSFPAFTPRRRRRTRMRIQNILSAVSPYPSRARRLRASMIALAFLVPVASTQALVVATDTEIEFLPPMSEGWISSTFGERDNPFTGERAHHNGIDIAAEAGTPVLAPAPGEVTFTGVKSAGYGLAVEIDHPNGFQTLYSQLASAEVQAGDLVEAGQLIGTVGASGRATGPHLHFELRHGDERLDPLEYLPLQSLAKPDHAAE